MTADTLTLTAVRPRAASSRMSQPVLAAYASVLALLLGSAIGFGLAALASGYDSAAPAVSSVSHLAHTP